MRVRINFSSLRMTKWSEYALRFLFGGAITLVAGVLAKRFGAELGGLFLAFPAIFPATATLIEKHERKKGVGSAKTARGRKAAALDAYGVTMGSIGLVGFGFAAWKLLPIWNSALTLFAALLVWTVLSFVIWRLRRHLIPYA
jgi:Protein of unknown function (DUF3147)